MRPHLVRLAWPTREYREESVMPDRLAGPASAAGDGGENRPTTRELTEKLLRGLGGQEPGSAECCRIRSKLVQLNMPLVCQVARRYRLRSEPMDDIVQAGAIGLIKAIDRFDAERGSFLAFAMPTIAGEIKRFFRDTSWWVRVPRRLRDRRLELYRSADELTQQLGRTPTVAELSRQMGLEEEQVLEGMDAAAAYTTSSLDATQFPGDHTPAPVDQLGSDDSQLELIEYRQDLGLALAELPAREREILLLRFYGNMTQAQIGEHIGISQMHVSRLLTGSLEYLRARLGAAT